jgi:hypothetical protein
MMAVQTSWRHASRITRHAMMHDGLGRDAHVLTINAQSRVVGKPSRPLTTLFLDDLHRNTEIDEAY